MTAEELFGLFGAKIDLSKFSEEEIKSKRVEFFECLYGVLDTLTPREEKVLVLRWGLEDGKEWSIEEVATYFNQTKERASYVEAKALRKLRHPSRANRLKRIFEK